MENRFGYLLICETLESVSQESLQKREERIAQNEEQQQKNMVELDRLMTNVEVR